MKDITFSMIAGYESEKRDMQNICRLLKNTELLDNMNARMPRGILLVGDPGVGKTMLAEALIHESGVKCVQINSDSIEPGTDMTRHIEWKFKEAVANKPSLIYIDEIDKLVSECDMFGSNFDMDMVRRLLKAMNEHLEDKITIIATANDMSAIAPALLRSGRFDRVITIPRPSKKDRDAIVEYYTERTHVSNDVDREWLSMLMAGYTGADIESIFNEAGIEAVMNGCQEISEQHFNSAIDRLAFNGIIRDEMMSDEEKRVVAIHEVGHLVASLLIDEKKVSTVTIIPQGKSLGHVNVGDTFDKLRSVGSVKKELVRLLAGKANETLFITDEKYMGAAQDIAHAYRLASGLMSSGCIRLDLFCHDSFEASQDKVREIEKGANKMLHEAMDEALSMMQAYESLSELFIEALTEKLTLTREEVISIYNNYRSGEGTLLSMDA